MEKATTSHSENLKASEAGFESWDARDDQWLNEDEVLALMRSQLDETFPCTTFEIFLDPWEYWSSMQWELGPTKTQVEKCLSRLPLVVAVPVMLCRRDLFSLRDAEAGEVAELVAAGALLEERDQSGLTAFENAVDLGWGKLALALLEAGAGFER
ncbi:MAG: hypothetical protein WCL27_14635, partial [Betaproteobacteria bacterium]